MKLSSTAACQELLEFREDSSSKAWAVRETIRLVVRRMLPSAGGTGMILVFFFAFGFNTHIARAQSLTSNVVTVDGIKYPYTAAGIQAAINAANALIANSGTGAIVQLPAASIYLGSTGLTMKSHVCLMGTSSDATWLSYGGTGSAITVPLGTISSCIKHISIYLGYFAGANAVGISLLSAYRSGWITNYNRIDDVAVSAMTILPGQIGINISDSNGVPSGVSTSWFENIMILNVGQPIVNNGQEGNFWNDLIINGFSTIAVNDQHSNDEFWEGVRISGAMDPSGIGFVEGGVLNQIHLTCDFGIATQTCVKDVPWGKNIWDISALSPVGVTAATSHYREIGAFFGNIPSTFQVSSLAVTNTSSTISSTGAGCLEFGDSDGSGGVNYVTFAKGKMEVSIQKPGFCK